MDLFGLSPSYGILTARAAHDWFLGMMREHEEFEVETDRAGKLPMPFWSETASGASRDRTGDLWLAKNVRKYPIPVIFA